MIDSGNMGVMILILAVPGTTVPQEASSTAAVLANGPQVSIALPQPATYVSQGPFSQKLEGSIALHWCQQIWCPLRTTRRGLLMGTPYTWIMT